MSTHDIGFNEELKKLSFDYHQISSKQRPYLFFWKMKYICKKLTTLVPYSTSGPVKEKFKI